MKKIYMILILVCLAGFSSFAQTTCAAPQVIATLPFTQAGLNTSASADNYDVLPCSNGTLGNYANGNDYIFSYTPTVDDTINIILTNTDMFASIFVTTLCPDDISVSCLAYNIESPTAHQISNLPVVGGTQYYIMISSLLATVPFPAGAQTIGFDIEVSSANCNIFPVANFTYSVVDTTVTFTNTSTDGSTYEWLFGDELIQNWFLASTDTNPVHNYAQYGTYTVQMVATSTCGATDTTSQIITLNCPFGLPTASFTYTVVDNVVTFTNTSMGDDSNKWLYGDEAINNWLLADTTSNPVHTYAEYGTYLVQMVASNVCGNDTTEQTIVLTCPGVNPNANFTYEDLGGGSVQFTNTSTDADSVGWFYGDELIPFMPADFTVNPLHEYATDGAFTVSCIAYNECGTDTMFVTINIFGTSIFSGTLNNSIQVFPVPAKQILNVNTSVNGTTLEIYNALGETISVFELRNNNAAINIENYPSGVYFIKVKDNPEIKRFVISH